MTYFGGAVHRNNFYFHILLFTSLHVSVSIGHPQVKFTQLCLEAITPTADPFLGYAVYYSILKNSVALVRERTIPTERPLLVGEVSANYRG
jgi:hypothetical protein